jgi:hypothetical protein
MTDPARPGDRVQDPFLVLEVETRRGQDPHTVLMFGSRTGSFSTGGLGPKIILGSGGFPRGGGAIYPPKNRNGRTAFAVTAVPRTDRLETRLPPPFFSFLATVWLMRRSGGRRKAPVLIPRPDGRPTWFVHASAASRIGSRTDPSHCTPRRYVGAGGARDWPHLFGPGDHQVHRCPE